MTMTITMSNLEEKMKSLKRLLLPSIAMAAFLVAGTAAKADSLTLTLNAPYQSAPATFFTFTGTIAYTNADSTNDGSVTEYLNGDSFSVDAPATLDDSSFLANAPLSMNPGDSWSGTIFTVTAPSWVGGGLPQNFYTGSFSIVGGSSPSDDTDVLATVNFDVQVTPEPGSFLLFGTGLMALALLARRKLMA